MIGVLVFLLLLLVAVQVIYNLYATSAVTAAAFDGARLAAGSSGGGEAEARQHVKAVLGEYGAERVDVSFTPDPDDVVLTVRADNPSFLPPALRRPLGFDRIERTVRVRIERDR
jgi:Flp pilus assembly protein TadG